MKVPARSTLLIALAALAACDESTTGPEGLVPVSLSVAINSTASPAPAVLGSAPVARAETYDDGTNTLVLDRVAIVVREIELERMFHDDCAAVSGDDDDCEEFETGPYLLEMPLDGTVEQVFSVDVPPDTYDELEFEIHKPGDDNPEERAFVQANPDFDDVSIRVEGTWNGEPFVFLQDLNAEQEMDLSPPLEITDGDNPVNLTLSLDLDGWFRDGSGALVDPRTANKGGENEDLVEDNIEASFEIFEDDDRDGEDDDDDDD